MPRTTIDIDASVLRELKRRQRREKKTLGQLASDLISRAVIVVAGEGERFWSDFKSVAAATPPRARLVANAHLVALMLEHGVSTMWSGDRDFRKFDGITVRDPFDERYSAGFE